MTPERKQFTIFMLRNKYHNKLSKEIKRDDKTKSVQKYIEQLEERSTPQRHWLRYFGSWNDSLAGRQYWEDAHMHWNRHLKGSELTKFKIKDYT